MTGAFFPGNSEILAYLLQRGTEIAAEIHHNKIEDITARAAAETLENPLFVIYEKRCGFLAVKRTAAAVVL